MTKPFRHSELAEQVAISRRAAEHAVRCFLSSYATDWHRDQWRDLHEMLAQMGYDDLAARLRGGMA